jgi:hypothetical protein
METELEIKITGGGTQAELVLSLRHLADAIERESTNRLDNVEWEDETLMTTIKTVE